MWARLRIAATIVVGVVVITLLVTTLIDRHHHQQRALAAGVQAGESVFMGGNLPAGLRPPTIHLRDQNGRRASLRSYRGQVVVLTYVYSHCENTCPIMIAQIRGALDELPRGGADVPVLAVSVDPAHDTPLSARRFILNESMTGRMRFLLGSRTQLAPIWAKQGIQPQTAKQEHTAYTFLVDKRGYERVGYDGHNMTPDGIAHDIDVLQGRQPPAGPGPHRGRRIPVTARARHNRGSARARASRSSTADRAPGALAALDAQANRLLPGGLAAFQARMASLRGHPVVINEWASSCFPCRNEFGYLQAAARRYHDRVAFLGVDVADDAGAARGFLADHPVGYPSYQDPDSKIFNALGSAVGTPITLFYDARGKQVGAPHIGAYQSIEQLEADIGRHLGAGG